MILLRLLSTHIMGFCGFGRNHKAGCKKFNGKYLQHIGGTGHRDRTFLKGFFLGYAALNINDMDGQGTKLCV